MIRSVLWASAYISVGVACGGASSDESPAEDSSNGKETGKETQETGDSTPNGTPWLSDPPENLLVIAFDTLRHDRVISDKMPRLVSVLEESMWFTDHRSCSNWTYLSFGCFLVGQSNIEQGWAPRGILDLGHIDDGMNPYPSEVLMLGEIFEASGFQTILTGSHPFLQESTGLFQGYSQQALSHQNADKVTQVARQVSGSLDSPWAMHVHFSDPHLPNEAPNSYIANFESLPFLELDLREKDLAGMVEPLYPVLSSRQKEDLKTLLNAYYDGEVAFMDEHFGVLWDSLTSKGVLEDTLVVFVSDHGEQFFEHEGFEHGVSLYGEENKALMAFWHPNLAASKSDWPSTNVDLLPTLLSLFNIDGPGDLSGYDLSRADLPETRPRFALHAEAGQGIQQSVILEDQLMIYDWKGSAERYSLDVDPNESTNVLGQDSESDTQLYGLLEPWVEALDALYPTETPKPWN